MPFFSVDSHFKSLYALVIVLVLIWINISKFYGAPYLTLALSNLVVILGSTPLYFWLQNPHREAIPLLPMHGFFYAVTFGIAGFNRFEKSVFDAWHFQIDSDTFNYALVCVIAGLASLYLAYYAVAPKLMKKVKKFPPFSFEINSVRGCSLLACLWFPLLCLSYWLSRSWAMADFTLSLQLLCQFLFYFLVAAYYKGSLGLVTKSVFLILILPYQFFIGSGFLEGSIGPLIVNLISICIIYFAVRRKLPWAWIALIVFTVFLIQPIKGELRSHIWQLKPDGTPAQLKQGITLADSFKELSRIIDSKYLSKQGVEQLDAKSNISGSYWRMNRLTTLVELIDLTPDPQPYRYGATYIPLLTKWIPRLLWQAKPRETLGNEWARTYGLTSSDDFSYSYNLPWIAEMYMNFGFLGVLGVSFLIGLLFYFFKFAMCCSGSSPGKLAFGVLLMTPLMFPESNLSLVLGGVMVGGILLSVFAFFVSKLMPKLLLRTRSF